jgi:hypothetical protein
MMLEEKSADSLLEVAVDRPCAAATRASSVTSPTALPADPCVVVKQAQEECFGGCSGATTYAAEGQKRLPSRSTQVSTFKAADSTDFIYRAAKTITSLDNTAACCVSRNGSVQRACCV